MKMLKKVLAIILTLSLLSGFFVSYAVSPYTWELQYAYPATGAFMTATGAHTPFKPVDKYVSMQNPPDFAWPYVYLANKYTLEIYKDEACTDLYKQVTLEKNFYNFNEPFEKGVNYYWRVRYYKQSNSLNAAGWSNWSDVMRFRIDPDAKEFLVPDTKTLIDRIPETHPKVFTTPDTLEEFRNIKNTNKVSMDTYNHFVEVASRYALNDSLPSVDEITTNEIALNVLEQLFDSGYAYLLSGDERIGAFAKKALLLVSSIDYTQGPTAYNVQDQRHRECMFKSAMVYDWIYDLLSEEERKTVRDMIVGRVTHEYTTSYGGKYSVLSDATEKLEMYSLESHAWTVTGYLGIVAYVLKGEVPEVINWLEEWFPLYIANMHPWSNEDGGWSQGTYYWSASTRGLKIIMDVLKLGGVIDLYKKVWVDNEALWTLYTYGNGSYGSFGDGSGRHRSSSKTIYQYVNGSMIRLAKYNDNKLARWLVNDAGVYDPEDPYNYYSGSGYYGEMTRGNEFAPSYAFKDVGWAVMTSDLEDPDRVQLTFKSSPYGSYNHSNADQNSFFIQAFGETLAEKRGYYDTYLSTHHSNFSRTSFAHNTITINNNHGQVDTNMLASGKLTQFVSQLDFDSVTGEAADAYRTELDPSYKYAGDLNKFDRNIIYIRPDVFLVVDDLEAADGETAQFEWHLATNKSMDYSNTSATVTKGNAVLSADVLYPATTYNYYNTYKNQIDGVIYNPSDDFFTKNPSLKSVTPYGIRFKTAKTDKTKMIVSMSVYKTGETKNVPEVTGDSAYKKLVYNKGTDEETTILVNLQDKEEPVTVDNITFKGTAVTFNAESIMLTNGTYLKLGEKELISTDKDATVALGHGQICISSYDDFNITIDSNNDYLTVTDINDLRDDKKRALSSEIGVSAKVGRTTDTNILTLSAQKGNYTIINGEAGVISPSHLVVEDINIQKTADNKAALFWTRKNGRSYQLKLSDNEIIDLTSVPYTFNVTDDVHCMYIRENLDGILGEWSKPIYISKYEEEKHDKVIFEEKTEEGKNYIFAKTNGLPSNGFFDMYLAKYNSNGVISGFTKADADGYNYSARIEKEDGLSYKTFILGKDLKPLTAAAYHNADSTKLQGIYIDGKLIEDFDDTVDSYEIYLEEDREIFPYVTAKVKNNTSKVEVDYNFECLRAVITVTAANGETREVVVQFKYQNVHVVKGATDIDAHFLNDSSATVSQDYVQSRISKYVVTKLSRKDTADSEYVDCNDFYDVRYYNKLYTNMRANKGGMLRGSRVFSNRNPYTTGNNMDISVLPEDLEGYDYFVFNMSNSTLKSKHSVKLEFDLEKDADIVILSTKAKSEYVNAGFNEERTLVDSVYLTPLKAEDFYYNIDLLKVGDFSDLKYDSSKTKGVLKDYNKLTEWYNVTPKVANDYTKYSQYQTSGLTINDFTVESTANKMFGNNTDFVYKYTKTFKANQYPDQAPITYNSKPLPDGRNYDVSIEIDYSSNDIIVIKPKSLIPFN